MVFHLISLLYTYMCSVCIFVLCVHVHVNVCTSRIDLSNMKNLVYLSCTAQSVNGNMFNAAMLTSCPRTVSDITVSRVSEQSD